MNRKPSLILSVAVAVVLLVPTIYVLSIGPAFRWWDGDGYAAMYEPVFWLARRSEFVYSVLDAYLAWWAS
ncbi:MAG: hypothetical protein IT428_32230 [Planctomycetaceae bacterium]|nr:hypothetical protein [Planctomycetaceae bacterium]